MKPLLTLAAGIAAMALTGAAHAADYDFTFTGLSYAINNGVFSTSDTANADGSFNIVTGSGTLISADGTLPQGAFTLTPGSGTTADGQSTYSNIYTPGTSFFGGVGAEFAGATFELNLYNGVAAAYPLCSSNCASVPNTGLYNPGDAGSVSITAADAVSAAPEPGAWALMLGGVGAMGLMLRRRRTAGAVT